MKIVNQSIKMPPKEAPKAEKPKEQSLKKRSDISVLKYDKYSYANFFKFEKELEEVAGYEFGDLFAFSKTGRYPVTKIPTKRTIEDLIQEEKSELPSDLDDADYELECEEIDERYQNLSDEEVLALESALKIEWENEIKASANEKVKRKQDKVKLFWLIKSQLSSESLDVIKQHMLAEYVKLELSQDPLTLWNAIKATHTSYSTGLKAADDAKARHFYQAFKQGKDQSLTEFKEKHEGILRSMESLGLTIPTEGEQAADFLQKLNEKNARKRLTIENNARLGGAYPTTLFEAYKLVSELADLPTINATSSSVFATKTDFGGKRVDPVKSQKMVRPKQNSLGSVLNVGNWGTVSTNALISKMVPKMIPRKMIPRKMIPRKMIPKRMVPRKRMMVR